MNEAELSKVAQKLMGRKRKNYHNKFFSESSKISTVTIPIVTTASGDKKILPFRNARCKTPECLYDFDEIMSTVVISPKGKFSMTCKICKAGLDLDGFFLDETLEEMIKDVFERYNIGNKFICRAVKVNRKGFWEAVVPDYVRQLDRNMREELGHDVEGNDQSRIFLNHYEDEGILVKAKGWDKLPSLRDYKKADYESLEEEFFERKNRDPKEVLIDRYDFPLRGVDFENWKNEASVSEAVVGFFLKYLEEFQINHSRTFTYEKGNRIFFMPVMVKGFERFYKTTKYDLAKGFSNPYFKNPDMLWKTYNLLELVLHYDERWILCIIELKTHTYYFLDLLEEDLSRVTQEEVIEIMKNLVETMFSLKIGEFKILPCKKINVYTDCGASILNFIYKSMINQNVPTIRIKYLEKENFKHHVGWLILTLALRKPQKLLYFDFPEDAKNHKGIPTGNNDNPAIHQQPARSGKPDNVFYFQHQEASIDWDKEMSKAWTFSEVSEIKNEDSSKVLPPDISDINSSLSFFNSSRDPSRRGSQLQQINSAGKGSFKSVLKNANTGGGQGRQQSLAQGVISDPRARVGGASFNLPILEQVRSNASIGSNNGVKYIDRTQLRNSNTNKLVTKSERNSRKPSGASEEMLNLNKEEFYEIINRYKEELRDQILKKGELFNQRGEKQIKVKKDQVHMTADQLKEILREHEEYIRGSVGEKFEADTKKPNPGLKPAVDDKGLKNPWMEFLAKQSQNAFPSNYPMSNLGMPGLGALGSSNNMFGLYPGMENIYPPYGVDYYGDNYDQGEDSEEEEDDDEEEEEEEDEDLSREKVGKSSSKTKANKTKKKKKRKKKKQEAE